MKKHFRELSVAAALGALLLLLAVAAPDFYKPGQLLTMLTTAAPVLLAAVGVYGLVTYSVTRRTVAS